MKLNKCAVVFDPEKHEYWLNGVQLKGVTGILERRLFQRKYDGVPQEVLAKAAKRGSFVHEMCDLVDSLNVEPEGCVEAKNYIELKKRYGLVSVASEYLVSDNEHYASSIDAVYECGEGVELNDRKTTSKLDLEYISWQLSIYAVFFERMNPDIPVKKLSATWLRGDIAEYVEVERKPAELVEALLLADINDEPFEWDDPSKDIPQFIKDRLEAMSFLNSRIKTLQAEFDKMKAEIMGEMESKDIKSVKTSLATFSYVAASSGFGFDKDAFQEKYPDLYNQFITKPTSKKASLTIKFK